MIILLSIMTFLILIGVISIEDKLNNIINELKKINKYLYNKNLYK